MFCVKCGTNLPDEAIFCSTCGTPQKAGVTSAVQETKYETCEIVFAAQGIFGKVTFWAKAVGAKGVYNAGKSLPFSSWGVPEARNMGANKEYSSLVEKLTEDGWESTGRNEDWFSTRFRRKLP